MSNRLSHKPWLMLGLGLSIGLLLGVGMLIGALVVGGAGGAPTIAWPETTIHATATDGSETMAMATGMIDEGVEGLFVLDFLTGNLQCSVLNPRTIQLGGMYQRNVVGDLGVEQGKQPRYLMVTGQLNFRATTGGNIRPAQCVVYVADANTGHFVAYGLPWDRAAASYNFAQVNPMVILGRGKARAIDVE